MKMDSIPFLIAKVILLALTAGLVIEYVYRRRALQKESEQNRYKRQQLGQLAQNLKNLKKEIARKGEFSEKIPVIAKKFTERLPESSFAAVAVRSAMDLFHARQVGYFVPVEGSPEYALKVGVGFPADWPEGIKIGSDEGILGLALQKKVVVSRMDPLSSAGRRLPYPSLESLGVTPDYVAPVNGASGILGVLVIAGSPFPLDEERKYVSMLADLASIAMQHAALFDAGTFSSPTDFLTGVSNRPYFLQRFENEIRRTENYAEPLSLFMFDIDEFKKINDTHGHPAGDVVIRKMAEIVRRHTRSSDLVGRYGGDEFMVLMRSANKEQALAYADHLMEKTRAAEILVPGHDAPLRLTISGGLAMHPYDGKSTTELICAADHALYEAKRRGRNRTVLAQSLRSEGAIPAERGEDREETTLSIGSEGEILKEYETESELSDHEWEPFP
jgi:diguanylate cyclase (GGDEF)-like protein